jgi:ABC-type multidrug transport system fused ATPase/permease subunit
VATLAVFLAAGTRIAPAVLRIQQGAIQMRLNVGASRPTLALIDELHDHLPIQQGKGLPSLNWPDFEPSIVLSNVSLKYPNSSRYAVRDVSLNIDPGEFVALVGPSGAGKTSLADLILGVISPTEGEILIGGLKPLDIISNKPGAMAYVPQNVSVLEGTISENVRFGLKAYVGDTSQLLRSLGAARLDQLISETPGGVDAKVGERGNNLSGGQKQRLGIARALYTNPKLLVLDESTSALDGQVESEITESIANLKGQVTLVMIAHRLSTIMGADKVVYMEEGKVLAVGKFDEVRKQIKDFDSQATLMGL